MEFFGLTFEVSEIVGFFGAAFILFGFYRTSIGRWQTSSFWYELDNLAGSVLLAAYHVMTETYVVLPLNILWATVAIKGMTSYKDRKKAVTNKR